MSTCGEVEADSSFEIFDWFVKWSNQNQQKERVDEAISVPEGSQDSVSY